MLMDGFFSVLQVEEERGLGYMICIHERGGSMVPHASQMAEIHIPRVHVKGMTRSFLSLMSSKFI